MSFLSAETLKLHQLFQVIGRWKPHLPPLPPFRLFQFEAEREIFKNSNSFTREMSWSTGSENPSEPPIANLNKKPPSPLRPLRPPLVYLFSWNWWIGMWWWRHWSNRNWSGSAADAMRFQPDPYFLRLGAEVATSAALTFSIDERGIRLLLPVPSMPNWISWMDIDAIRRIGHKPLIYY